MGSFLGFLEFTDCFGVIDGTFDFVTFRSQVNVFDDIVFGLKEVTVHVAH